MSTDHNASTFTIELPADVLTRFAETPEAFAKELRLAAAMTRSNSANRRCSRPRLIRRCREALAAMIEPSREPLEAVVWPRATAHPST